MLILSDREINTVCYKTFDGRCSTNDYNANQYCGGNANNDALKAIVYKNYTWWIDVHYQTRITRYGSL